GVGADGRTVLVGGGGARVVEPVKALVPLRPAVRPGADEVVVGGIDERRGPGVRGLLRRPRRRFIDGEPRPVRTEASSAAENVLCCGGAAVGGRGDAVARERVEVDEVLLAAAVEVEIGIPSTRRRFGAGERARRRPGRDGAEAVAAVDGTEPDASLRSGSGGTAHEDASLRVDADIWLTECVDRVGDRRR